MACKYTRTISRIYQREHKNDDIGNKNNERKNENRNSETYYFRNYK